MKFTGLKGLKKEDLDKLFEQGFVVLKDGTRIDYDDGTIYADDEELVSSEMPLGSIMPLAIETDDPRLQKLDGRSLSQNGVYAEFCAWLKNRLEADASTVPTCSIEEYAHDMETYGQCGKFVINDTIHEIVENTGDYHKAYSVKAHSIKLPTITEFIASNNGGDAIGLAELDEFKSHNHYIHDYTDVGAPNDPQSLKVNSGINTTTGYYSVYTANTGGEETRPKNIRYPYYIVVATGTKTDVKIDLNNVATEINSINLSINKLNNKFYFERQYYEPGSAQEISGTSSVKLSAFGDIVIDFPRDGVYEITTYIYCYAGNGGDASYRMVIDGKEVEGSAVIMGQNLHIAHPLSHFVNISKGTHTINIFGKASSTSRTFNMSPYNTNQITIKEL